MESTWDYITDIIRLSNGKKSKLVHQPKNGDNFEEKVNERSKKNNKNKRTITVMTVKWIGWISF